MLSSMLPTTLYHQILHCHALKPTTSCIRLFHTSKVKKLKKHEITEIQIPVPWGHVAGKWWGEVDCQPVLALHGVQDNAATFDKLVPLLNVDAVLAVDIPGHGWSSHIPQGFPYDVMDAVCFMRFLINYYFKWSQPVVLIGHSFGSAISYMYSAIYPDQVSKYVSLDCSRHIMTITHNKIDSMRNTMDKIIELEGKLKPPEYTYDGLLQAFHQGRKARLTKESCEILLSRGMTKLDSGKVYLSRDVRLKLNAFSFPTPEYLLNLATGIKCDVLSIQVTGGTVKDNSKGELYKNTVNLMLQNSSKSKHVILEGNHHLHLDNPKPVAHVINNFLS